MSPETGQIRVEAKFCEELHMAMTSSKDDGGTIYPSGGAVSGSSSSSFIGKTLKIDGDLSSDENVTIEGKVKGKIKATSLVTIGVEGSVDAEIKAREVRILGHATGHIEATHRLEIVAGGHFTGDIQSEKIVIQEGAIFKGNINMEDKPKPFSISDKGSGGTNPTQK